MKYHITDIFQYNTVLEQLNEVGFFFYNSIKMCEYQLDTNLFLHTLQFILDTSVKQNIIFHERLDQIVLRHPFLFIHITQGLPSLVHSTCSNEFLSGVGTQPLNISI